MAGTAVTAADRSSPRSDSVPSNGAPPNGSQGHGAGIQTPLLSGGPQPGEAAEGDWSAHIPRKSESTGSWMGSSAGSKNGGLLDKLLPDETSAKASFSATIMNIINNVVGVGVLSLPWALRQASLGTGAIVIGSSLLLSSYSFVILAAACDAARVYSYQDLARVTLTGPLAVAMDLATFFFPFTGNLGYAIAIGDYVRDLVRAGGEAAADSMLAERWLAILVVGVLVLIPLSAQQYFHNLRHASYFAVAAVIFVAIVTVVEYADAPALEAGEIEYFRFDSRAFQAIGVTTFTFAAHYNSPNFYQELSNRSIGRYYYTSVIAFVLVALVNGLIAVSAYLTFGSKVESNVLNSYGLDAGHLVAARSAMLVNICFSYPLIYGSVRRSFMTLSNRALARVESVRRFDDGSKRDRYVVTVFLVGLTMILGIVIDDLGVVVAVSGSIIGSFVCFLFPGWAYYKFVVSDAEQWGRISASRKAIEYALLTGVTIFGVGSATIGTYTSLVD